MPADALVKPLKRISAGIADAKLSAGIRQLEDKIVELDLRLRDLERRVTVGGL